MKKIIGQLTFVFLLLGCDKSDESSNDNGKFENDSTEVKDSTAIDDDPSFTCYNPSGSIYFFEICRGDVGGSENIPKQSVVISNNNTWNDLVRAMDLINIESDRFTEKDIDFSNFIVLAVFDSIRPTLGHSIDIIEVVENDNSIIVKIENLLKGGDIQTLSQPFHIVKVCKTTKPFVFEVVN